MEEDKKASTKDTIMAFICGLVIIFSVATLISIMNNNSGIQERINNCLREGNNMSYCNNEIK